MRKPAQVLDPSRAKGDEGTHSSRGLDALRGPPSRPAIAGAADRRRLAAHPESMHVRTHRASRIENAIVSTSRRRRRDTSRAMTDREQNEATTRPRPSVTVNGGALLARKGRTCSGGDATARGRAALEGSSRKMTNERPLGRTPLCDRFGAGDPFHLGPPSTAVPKSVAPESKFAHLRVTVTARTAADRAASGRGRCASAGARCDRAQPRPIWDTRMSAATTQPQRRKQSPAADTGRPSNCRGNARSRGDWMERRGARVIRDCAWTDEQPGGRPARRSPRKA